MKKIVVFLFAVLCCMATVHAVPAYRGLITFTQPDGSTIRVRLHGDEFCHWMTDESGQEIAPDADGYFRPVSIDTHNARVAAGERRRSRANAARRRSGEGPVAIGKKHFLVILVEFKDEHFTYSGNDFVNLLNEVGYDGNGGTGSARDFYFDNSHGGFEPVFDVYGPVEISNDKAYYGGNDSNGDDLRPEEAIIEGCRALDSSIDFSQYDNDGDGEVDLVFMYYAGKGEADGGSTDCIWPHQWDLTSAAGASLRLDGKKIDKYACTNEIVGYGDLLGQLCGIGTACHEFGHAMGLPDMYDTNENTNGNAGGLYDYSTMCSGSYNNEGRTPPYFNIEERILLGWLDESALQEFPSSGTYTLGSVNGDVAYKSPTDMDGEYFLYECRSKQGWDAYIPEAGLIVYHVDKSSRKVQVSSTSIPAITLWENWTIYNALNANGSHPCFYVVPAGSQSSLNYNSGKFAFPGKANATSFTATSWNGVASDVKLSSISYAGNTVSLYAEVPSTTLNYNVIANPGHGVYSAGSSFQLALEESSAQPVSSVQWYFDDEPVSGSTVTLPAGSHVVEAHLTLASGETKIVELTLRAE